MPLNIPHTSRNFSPALTPPCTADHPAAPPQDSARSSALVARLNARLQHDSLSLRPLLFRAVAECLETLPAMAAQNCGADYMEASSAVASACGAASLPPWAPSAARHVLLADPPIGSSRWGCCVGGLPAVDDWVSAEVGLQQASLVARLLLSTDSIIINSPDCRQHPHP
jgi:hypothetical protein